VIFSEETDPVDQKRPFDLVSEKVKIHQPRSEKSSLSTGQCVWQYFCISIWPVSPSAVADTFGSLTTTCCGELRNGKNGSMFSKRIQVNCAENGRERNFQFVLKIGL
jgi:hypothetical protein